MSSILRIALLITAVTAGPYFFVAEAIAEGLQGLL